MESTSTDMVPPTGAPGKMAERGAVAPPSTSSLPNGKAYSGWRCWPAGLLAMTLGALSLPAILPATDHAITVIDLEPDSDPPKVLAMGLTPAWASGPS